MAVRIGSGLSVAPDAREGAEDAAAQARLALDGAACDVAVVFASGAHLSAPEATLEAIHDTLAPGSLVGCAAQGVLGARREVEEGTAVSVWAASLGGGSATAFHAPFDGDTVTPEDLPDLEGADGAILLADPFSFPADSVLHALSERSGGLPLVGGLASARFSDGSPGLMLGDDVADGGAVGLRFDGVDLVSCVSQGATPIGPELTITAAEGNVIVELAGKPAYTRLQAALQGLEPFEQHQIQASGGLLLGIVIDANKPDYVQGDFLVRPIIGADPRTGAMAVGALVRPGQVVRIHVRDAASADRDLRESLNARSRALGSAPAGALVFSCNGRGRSMFGAPDHDAGAVKEVLAGAPAAGFFAAGEIGPVGGEYFVHSFTATVAVFA